MYKNKKDDEDIKVLDTLSELLTEYKEMSQNVLDLMKDKGNEIILHESTRIKKSYLENKFSNLVVYLKNFIISLLFNQITKQINTIKKNDQRNL